MLELRLDPAGGFKKCARVVGDVIGKFHPHGDVAVYDALVRLAQDFAQRYPLVDGQGNFGNIDGDNAAAMRYTESRLTAVAMALLDGIDEDAVDFRHNYDGSDEEPVVLPAAFPNLLANGASGIAVGMATSIPPHNAGELLSALAWMAGRPPMPPLPDGRGAAAARPGPRPADRRLAGRARGQHRRGLPHRPRQLPAARALGEGGAGLRPVPGDRHRDPLSGAERPADRADGRAAGAEEAAAAGRPARRIDRDGAAGAGAQEPRGHARAADGAAVPHHRARGPALAQHERAGRRRRAARDEPGRGARGLPRAPHGGAGPPLAAPAGQGPGPARGAGGLPQGASSTSTR